jgi:hypothetical protein
MKKAMQLAVLFIGVVSVQLSVAQEASRNQYWMEFGVGGDFTSLQMKTAKNDKGWALGYFAYDEFEFLNGDRALTKDGRDIIDDEMREYSLLRIYRHQNRWFASDLGIGLGHIEGYKAESCTQTTSENLFWGSVTTDYCDKARVKGLSLPVEANFIFGRYLGIGVKLRATFAEDFNSASAGITIPLGTFTKR